MAWSLDTSCAQSLDKHGTAHLVYSDQMFKKKKKRLALVGEQFFKLWDHSVAAMIHWPQRTEEEAPEALGLSGWVADSGRLICTYRHAAWCVCDTCTHRYRISPRFLPLQSQVCSLICALTWIRPPLATISSHNQQVQPSPAGLINLRQVRW